MSFVPTSAATHRRSLVNSTVLVHALTFCLIFLSSYLPLFDSSPRTVLPSPTTRLTGPLLRWDAFHFAHIAQSGYLYEYEWFVFPGTPIVMRIGGCVLSLIKAALGISSRDGSGVGDEWVNLLQGGALMALACDTTITLYELSLEVLGSSSLALISAGLSLIPSSPATLHYASYSEPFFTYLSYKGMLACSRVQWLRASLYFALAGTFRSNGIVLSGYILWGLIFQPFLDGKKSHPLKFIYATLLTALILMPFIYHQYSAYRSFCIVTLSSSASASTRSASPAPWCTAVPPSIYPYVQSKYWNVGFLRYWSIQQLPNFLISAPVYVVLFVFCFYHLSHTIPALLPFGSQSKFRPRSQSEFEASPFLSVALIPYALHALFLTTTLLVTSHVQIILRLAASMPVTYWAGAWLIIEGRRAGEGNSEARGSKEKRTNASIWKRWNWGKLWVGWSVVWGAMSIVLWVTFLPPA